MCRPEVYDGGWISGGHAVAVIAECVLVAIPEWFVEPRDDFRQAAHADATNRRLLGAGKRRVEGDRAILEDAERERDDSGCLLSKSPWFVVTRTAEPFLRL
jgi:hypothetical protein